MAFEEGFDVANVVVSGWGALARLGPQGGSLSGIVRVCFTYCTVKGGSRPCGGPIRLKEGDE